MAMAMVHHGATDQTPDGLMNLYKTWNIWDDWGIPKGQFMWWWEHAVDSGEAYLTGIPPQEAVQALWELSDREWHIHICTSRLNLFRKHDVAAASTIEWLRKYAIPYRSLSFTEDKSLIYADAIVDDKPSTILASPAEERFLFPAPHNRIEALTMPDYITVLGEEYPWSELLEFLGSGEV